MYKEIMTALMVSLFLHPGDAFTGNVRIEGAELKWVKRTKGSCTYRAKIKATNTTISDIRVMGWFIFYDGEGFEIWKMPFTGLVRGGESADMGVAGMLMGESCDEVETYEAVIEAEYMMKH